MSINDVKIVLSNFAGGVNVKRKNLIASKLILSLLAFVFIISNTLPAFAFSEGYMNVEKWSYSDNITSESISTKGAFGNLTGTLSYFVDNEEYCVYIWLNLYENSITSNSFASVNLDFQSSGEKYQFSVDEEGAVYYSNNEDQYFNVNSSFVNTKGNGNYIVAVDINNGYTENLMSISASINGNKYVIKKNIPIIAPVEPTTTKAPKTTKAKSSSPTKSKNKNKAYATTKFHFNGNVKSSVNTKSTTEKPSAPLQQYDDAPKVQYSQRSIIILIACGVALLIGLIFIIVGQINTKIAKQQKNKDNQDE